MRHLSTKRRPTDRTRGQSLVEFALVLPILLFLTVIALDFGRIYLGWVNLQSMTRIAANFAANHPSAWTDTSPTNLEAQTQYQNQIRADARATNCALPLVGGVPTAPIPTFSGPDLGDTATVAMSCTFNVITPGVSGILGGSVTVSASSAFPVSNGMTVSGTGGGTPVPPTAAFTGNGVQAPSTISCTAPCTVTFRDTSGGYPSEWHWDFADGEFSGLQDPLGHTFTMPGTYVVTMTATNYVGSSTESMGITVTESEFADFVITQPSPNAPSTVTFTDASASGVTAWAWDFGAGEGTATGQNVSHTYSTPGTYTVTLTATYPTGPESVTKSVTVGSDLCKVPSLADKRRNEAPGIWSAGGFSGLVTSAPTAPNGNFIIKSQSVVSSSWVACTSGLVVNDH